MIMDASDSAAAKCWSVVIHQPPIIDPTSLIIISPLTTSPKIHARFRTQMVMNYVPGVE